MKNVQQRHKQGCGIAAVATLLDISYQDAVKLFTKRKIKHIAKFGSWTDELADAIKRSGRVPLILSKRTWRDFKYNCIVNVLYENGKGHFVVWDASQQRFLDPQASRDIKKYGKLDHKNKYIAAFKRRVESNEGPTYIIRLI